MSSVEFKQTRFTLLEIIIALAIFAVSVLILIERRNYSLESCHYATNLLRAQEIVDEVMAWYYLHPFEKEAVALEKDYNPYKVDVNVSVREKPNIYPDILIPIKDEIQKMKEEEEDKRVILDIHVAVSFGSIARPRDMEYTHEVHTLMRHVELKEEDE